MSSCYFLCPQVQHLYNYLMYIIFLSKAWGRKSKNFQPPCKWLLDYFISRPSVRACVDIRVSVDQPFIHKTLCSDAPIPDNVRNQEKQEASVHSNIWSVLFKSHLLIIFWDLRILFPFFQYHHITSLKVSPNLMKWELDISQDIGTMVKFYPFLSLSIKSMGK